MQVLRINKQEFDKLRSAYEAAVFANKHIFAFQGKLLVTDYAKYLLQWLEPNFAERRSQNITHEPQNSN